MKTLKSYLSILGLLVSTCTHATAATLPKSDQGCNQWSIGIEGYHYRYREPGLMKSNGFMYGLNGAYNITFGNNFFLQPDLRLDYGRTNYKSYRTGSLKHEPNWLFEPRIIFGKRFCTSPDVQWDPYIGLGYRFKADDTDGMISTTGHGGYFRSSQYLYMPIGVTLHNRLCDGWSLSPTIEFDAFLWGRQRSDIFGGTLHNKQKRGFGLRGEVMVNKEFNKGTISVGPFINYWSIKDSEISGNGFSLGIEPRNKTVEAGLQIKYIF